MSGVERNLPAKQVDRTGFLPRRIHVVGTSGTGKTTFAARLAESLSLPHVELDSLFWGPNWSEAPEDVFRQKVDAVTQKPAWVIDGNYSRVRGLVWQRADTIIWLDYRLSVTLPRVFRRTLRRGLTREALWQGNRESLRRSFLSKESIILWSLRTYRRRKRDYPRLLGLPEHRHLHTLRIRSPREARQVLASPRIYPWMEGA